MKFIVFSDDWGVHPSSCQHLFRHISRKHEVAWINTVGMRSPTLSSTDIGKARTKLSKMMTKRFDDSTDASSASFSVVQPLMLPFTSQGWCRRLNRLSAARVMRSLYNPEDRPIVLTTVPNACDYVDTIPSAKIVYYCVDDFSEWPGMDRDLILEMEDELICKADTLIATSERLYDRLSSTGKPTHMLEHGVDVEHFSRTTSEEHPVLDNIPAPRVGFFGLFDDRSNKDLIRRVALSLPKVSFVIAGPVETNIDSLNDMPNIYFAGRIAYDHLPSYITGISVLMIPYKIDALSKSLSPLKLKEYLVTGKPIITTPIAATEQFVDDLVSASTANQWSESILEHLNQDVEDRKEALITKFRHESWSNKADMLVEICKFETGT